MAKERNLNIRLDDEEMDALSRAAMDDDRPTSALARRVLINWLRDNGWLAEKRQVVVPVDAERRERPVRKPPR